MIGSVHWIAKAWGDVKSEAIVKCFASVEFSVDCSDVNESGYEFEDDDVPLPVLVRNCYVMLLNLKT